MAVKIGLALFVIVAWAVSFVEAREVVSADVKIRQVQAAINIPENKYMCTVTVHNDNDDNAQLVKLLVILPLEVQYTSASVTPARHWTPCDASALEGRGGNGYVHCELGEMNNGEAFTVTIETTAPSKDIPRKSCGVFVWSQIPDPDRSNYRNSVEP
jgi:hypothetical protein